MAPVTPSSQVSGRRSTPSSSHRLEEHTVSPSTQFTATTLDREDRPWGSWEILAAGGGYKIKRITIAPCSRLPLQIHVHRAGHWLVVVGVATCTIGEESYVARAGEHVFVPRGAPHRIANDQPDGLILIEVQVGSFTGEDDIVRLQDDCGRD
jgi:mannose-6-phosphate isomerase